MLHVDQMGFVKPSQNPSNKDGVRVDTLGDLVRGYDLYLL
jgi:hypothetical protein